GRDGARTPVTRFMVRDVEVLGPETPLEAVLERLYQSPARAVGVGDPRTREITGYVSAENASELFLLDRARRQSAEAVRA
ncbi:MAG: hypothetical protein AAGI34_20115, partial [Pseudomonadota bacterium]